MRERFIGYRIVVFTVDATHSEGRLDEVHHGYIVLNGDDAKIENNSNDVQVEDPPKIYIATYYIVSFGLEDQGD